MSRTPAGWSQFRLAAFGEPYLVWHDGPDFAVLDELWGSDNSFVENALLDGLSERDPLAAQSTWRLALSDGSRDRFVAALTGHLGDRPAGFHLRVAEALFRLTGDQAWSREVVRVLLGAGFWNDRFDAAIVLKSFRPSDEIIEALATCVKDPDYLVRYHASNTLLHYAGLRPDVTAHDHFFARIGSRSTAADWSVAAEGLADTAKSVIRR